jgi:hypothetical protein
MFTKTSQMFSDSLEKQSLTVFPVISQISIVKFLHFNYLDLRNYRNKRETMLETIICKYKKNIKKSFVWVLKSIQVS